MSRRFRFDQPGQVDALRLYLDSRSRNLINLVKQKFMERVSRRTPVRTGALLLGWETRNKVDGFEVGNGVPYAKYVEEGTEKMAPRRMVASTVEEFDEIMDEALKELEEK